MKDRLYIETSVISYLTARTSRDLVLAAYQKLTAEWWAAEKNRYILYISAFVLDEISQGDSSAAAKRLAVLEGIPVLAINAAVKNIADVLFVDLRFPDHARLDCFHLAIAAVHGMDFVLSWNFKHMVNPRTRKAYREICEGYDIVAPEIATPEELYGGLL